MRAPQAASDELPAVLSVGIFCVDILVRPVPAFPPPGGLVLVDEYDVQTGGCANNCAIALARLGVSVAAVGRLGNDRFGDLIVSDLRANGVRTSFLVRDPAARTAMSVVLVNERGERSFVHHRGATVNLSAADVPRPLPALRALHIGGAFLLPSLDGEGLALLCHSAQEQGLLTFVDTAVDGRGNPMAVIAPALPYIDYLLPSEAEALGMTGAEDPQAMAARLLAQGARAVCIKLGERGCYCAGPGEAGFVPAYDVPVVDTCGAGDTFTAGFIAGVLAGKGLMAAAQLANAVGAMCVMSLGATAGIGSWEETQRFMATTPLRTR